MECETLLWHNSTKKTEQFELPMYFELLLYLCLLAAHRLRLLKKVTVGT